MEPILHVKEHRERERLVVDDRSRVLGRERGWRRDSSNYVKDVMSSVSGGRDRNSPLQVRISPLESLLSQCHFGPLGLSKTQSNLSSQPETLSTEGRAATKTSFHGNFTQITVSGSNGLLVLFLEDVSSSMTFTSITARSLSPLPESATHKMAFFGCHPLLNLVWHLGFSLPELVFLGPMRSSNRGKYISLLRQPAMSAR